MSANPRIDELRKRLERDPQSRLFAQLAEELRKDGDFSEAIQVARDGLARHPQYPSARLTLGRALMDTGDTRGAVKELEAAVKGAPDNLLAGRLLAECLEAEGQLQAALERYRATLALADGDRQLGARVAALEQSLSARAAAAASPARDGSEPVAEPIPILSVDEPMELEAPYERPAAVPAWRGAGDEDVFDAVDEEPPPIPLVADASEEFELERPYDALAMRAPVPMPAIAPEDAGIPVAAQREPEPEILKFEPAPEPDLNSSTLAELYFNQGFTDQAIDVYRQIAEREPDNERVRSRLRELEALQRHLRTDEASPTPAAPPASAEASAEQRAARRQVLERTIGRLEGLQAALKRG